MLITKKALHFFQVLAFTFIWGCSHNSVLYKDVDRLPSSVSGLSCKELFKQINNGNALNSKVEFEYLLGQNFSKSEAKKIKENLEALSFIDYQHQYDLLYTLDGETKKLSQIDIGDIYSNSGSTPFENYQKANQYLLKNNPPFNSRTLKNVHQRMMKGGVDDLSTIDLGRIRDSYIIGNIPKSDPISQTQYDEMVKNPYINVGLIKRTGDDFYGEIGYPNVENITPEALEFIKKRNKKLYDSVIVYQNEEVGDFEELTSKVVNELTEDLLEWFVKQKDQIGEITSTAKLKKYVDVVANFQRNLISIHPFADGNGRSVRQFALYYPFQIQGIPPPRLSNPDADLYTPIEDWKQQILDGVFNSIHLYQDLSGRIQKGLPLENSPQLYFPKIPENVLIFEKEGAKAIGKNGKSRTVKSAKEEFTTYSFVRLRTDDEMKELFKSNPDLALKKLGEDYLEFVKNSKIDYFHEKFGKESVSVNLIELDFFDTFANKSFKNKKDWDQKMKAFYLDQTVWRGLSRQDEVIEEDEIISMFTDVHHQFVSNRVMGEMTDSDSAVREAFKDFKAYNDGVVNGGLEEMAMDHSRAGRLYDVSYGYSTSKKRSVGKAFAMGAMVIADYGEHQKHQHLLKSRVLVGLKRGKKDVDLMRLKQVRDDFSYKYFRQEEVMGIGAADPDSTQFVQLIDADGSTLVSYVRNPKKPDEILVFEGEVSETTNLSKIKPIKKINLQ